MLPCVMAIHKSAYSVARSLGAAKASLHTELFKLDGTLTQSSQEVIERWDEHFADVFMGSLQSLNSLKTPEPPPHGLPCSFDFGPEATADSFAQLGRGKGMGPDGIPAELLQSGGLPAATLYSVINRRVSLNFH